MKRDFYFGADRKRLGGRLKDSRKVRAGFDRNEYHDSGMNLDFDRLRLHF